MSSDLLKFQAGQASGLVATVIFAVLSLAAIDFVWLRVVWVTVNALFKRASLQSISRERVFFTTHLGAYVTSLLLANGLTGVAYVMNAIWVKQGGVNTGALCVSQGMLTQAGDIASAYFTAAIAIHTYSTLALRRRVSPWFCALIIALGWLLAIVTAVLPSRLSLPFGPIYNTDGGSCGISLEYPLFQTVLHLVPVLTAALLSAIFYSLVYLIIRGTISIKGGIKLNLDLHARRSTQYDAFEYPELIAAIAKSMLLFPIAYVLLMLPHLIICLTEASGISSSFAAKTFSLTCSSLLGFANVLIFYNTLRVMGPAFGGPAAQKRSKDIESFASPVEKSPVQINPPSLWNARPFPAPNMTNASTAAPSIIAPRPAAQVPQRVGLPRSPAPRGPRQAPQVRESSESTRGLLGTHTPSSSVSTIASSVKSVSAASLQRPITSVAKLNAIITAPAPVYVRSKSRAHGRSDSVSSAESDDSLRSLPAPRRTGRSPVERRPTLPAITSPVAEKTTFNAVNLDSPLSSADYVARPAHDSFISMYGSRSPIGGTPEQRLTFGGNVSPVKTPRVTAASKAPVQPRRGPGSVGSIVVPDSDVLVMPSFTSPEAATPPSAYDSPLMTSQDITYLPPRDATSPLGNFMRTPTMISSAIRGAFREQETNAAQKSAGAPSYEWAALVANAATSGGGVMPSTERSARRSSRSLDIAVPPVLRPQTPGTARTPGRDPVRRFGMPSSPFTNVSTGPDGALRNVPSRTPVMKAGTKVAQPSGYF